MQKKSKLVGIITNIRAFIKIAVFIYLIWLRIYALQLQMPEMLFLIRIHSLIEIL